MGERRTTHTCRAMPNASGTLPLQLALGGEELWQQEGRTPHCLQEGALFLIVIPRALSPERNEALAPHWTEHTASLHTAEGHCSGGGPGDGSCYEGERD